MEGCAAPATMAAGVEDVTGAASSLTTAGLCRKAPRAWFGLLERLALASIHRPSLDFG